MKKRYSLQLSDKAEKDFDEAFGFYASTSELLAYKFYDTVNDHLHTITQSPETYQIFYKDVHRFVISKFPFIIQCRLVK